MAASAAETIQVLRGRLYWSCVRVRPGDSAEEHFFCTDDSLVYDPYYGDFGPLTLSNITKYCRLLNAKLADPSLEHKRIVHCCRPQHDTRANSVMLVCCWSLLYDNKSPEEAFAPFAGLRPVLCPYRDASLGPPCFNLTVLHCLMGLAKGREFGWYNADTFDTKEYDYYERVENGDFNWIVPGKFLAFSGPTQTPIAYVDGVKTNTPETYFEYFDKLDVTGIVRFNNKVYDRKKFLEAGFNHYDLYFSDGGNPTDAIIKRFMEIAETEKGGLAVHCKAGLGRTGTLISLYLMKHYQITACEMIGWIRLCRPGSVIGPQQLFLMDLEKRMWQEVRAAKPASCPSAFAPPFRHSLLALLHSSPPATLFALLPSLPSQPTALCRPLSSPASRRFLAAWLTRAGSCLCRATLSARCTRMPRSSA
jgi:cell division cycle 14